MVLLFSSHALTLTRKCLSSTFYNNGITANTSFFLSCLSLFLFLVFFHSFISASHSNQVCKGHKVGLPEKKCGAWGAERSTTTQGTFPQETEISTPHPISLLSPTLKVITLSVSLLGSHFEGTTLTQRMVSLFPLEMNHNCIAVWLVLLHEFVAVVC